MTTRTRLTDLESVHERGSWLFTVRDAAGRLEEGILVPCGTDGVRGWVNRCTHQSKRLDRGDGAATRDGAVVCPRHGSLFDACSGACDNGPAADTALPPIDVTLEDGVVYLTDPERSFAYAGGIDDGDDGPSSTSHIGF